MNMRLMQKMETLSHLKRIMIKKARNGFFHFQSVYSYVMLISGGDG